MARPRIWLFAFLTVACSSGPPHSPAARPPVDRQLQSTPRATPKPPAGPETPVDRPAPPRPSPPVLSPQVADGDRVREEVTRRIGHAAHIVDGIDESNVQKDQQEIYASLLDFLSKARGALASDDLASAQVLSEKASRLADALAKTR